MKAAVIGAGPHGRRIIDVVKSMESLTLAAIVDRQPDALASLELSPEVKRYTSDAELWSRGDIELLCIATNGPSHAALAEAAIGAGVRCLLVEKPMACSLAECDRIIDVSRSKGVRLAVGHTRRFAPVYRWIRERIASGDWGKLRGIWIQRPDIGLGCNATHSFDLAMYLADCSVRRVTGWVDEPIRPNPRGEQFRDPGGTCVLEMEGGIRAMIAQIEDGAGPTSLELDLTGARIRLCERSGALEVMEAQFTPPRPRPTGFIEGVVPAGLTAKQDMHVMIRSCLTDLISDTPPMSGPEQGRAAVEVLIAIYLSHERGNVPVELPLTLPEETAKWLPVT